MVSILSKASIQLNFDTIQNQVDMTATIQRTVNYVHAHGMPYRGQILMVVSSPTISQQTGWPIGFWASELTHPLQVFQEAGYQVTIASTEGGAIEMDSYSDPRDPSGYSAHDVISMGYLQSPTFLERLKNTTSIQEIDISAFDAIFLVGGQAPMYTFKDNPRIHELLAQFLESNKPTAAVCHATTALLGARDAQGVLLVEGRTWTGFTNAEEAFADQAVGQRIQPYWIEDEAQKIPNTNFITAEPFSAHAIADGKLITGQQQNSGAAAARMVIEQLQD